MQAAQKLYEGVDIGGETVGLITYMRTDGVQSAPEALTEAREVIAALYGKDYVPEEPRYYKTKAKNAQEAHEAIRPTSLERNPGRAAPGERPWPALRADLEAHGRLADGSRAHRAHDDRS